MTEKKKKKKNLKKVPKHEVFCITYYFTLYTYYTTLSFFQKQKKKRFNIFNVGISGFFLKPSILCNNKNVTIKNKYFLCEKIAP